MASYSSNGFSHLRPGALHISLQICKTQPKEWRKRTNKQTRTWVNSKRKKGEVYVTLLCSSPCNLQAIAGVYFARNFHKAPRNADSSLDCPASIFSPPPSVDCVLLCTTISGRLFSSALLCQLALSVFSGAFLPSTNSGLEGGIALRPFMCVSRQSKQRD